MKRVYREHIIALLAFVLLTVVMTFPVAFRMQEDIAGSGGDPWQSMWRFEEKAESGFSGFVTDVLGRGEPRLANLSVWPWMPLHLLFGQPFTYNLVWLLHFILAGYAMALLVKILTVGKSILEPAPLLAGLMYMLIPYHVAHSLGHFGAMQLQWIPFIAIAALSLFRSPSIWRASVLGILLSIQAWTEHHYIVWIALFGLIAGFVYRNEVKQKLSLLVPSLGILSLILIIGILFPFIPTIRLAATQSSALELGMTQTIRFSADLFSFITPPSTHPIWGDASDSLFGKYFTGNKSESVQYLGISVVIAILFFHRHIPQKQKRLWFATILFFGIMSLGPVLHVFGRETDIPLPYAIVANAPVFSAIRVIARAGVMVSFAAAVLFGWVIATNPPDRRATFRFVPYLIGGIILLEFMFFVFPMQSAKLSPIYAAIEGIPGSHILELPAATNYTAASRSLYASRIHGKEVLGNIALERGQSAEAYDIVRSFPALRQLLFLRTTDLSEMRTEFFSQDLIETLPDVMKYLNTYAIIIHTDSLSDVQNTAVREFLERDTGFVSTSYEDAVLVTLDPQNTSRTDGVFLVRKNGWEHVCRDKQVNSVFAEVSSHASVSVINTNSYPVAIELQYELTPESQGELLAETRVVVQPGEHEVVFTHTGEGTSIIKNPEMHVTPVL